MKSSTLTLSLLLVLTGCTALGPKYEERTVETVLKESAASQEQQPDELPTVSSDSTFMDDVWWTKFNDATLTQLLAMAYDHNRSLEAARANLAAARAAWEYSEGALWPTVDLSGDITRSRTSYHSRSGHLNSTNYNLGVGLRWEADFFGREQFLVDAAQAEAEASAADLRAMWVSVSANVASYYLELRTLQGRLMVAQDNLRLQQANYDLQADRNAHGLTNDLIISQAEYDLRSTAATIPSLKAQIVAAQNSIAILCGATPGTLNAELLAPVMVANATPAPHPGAAEDVLNQVSALRPTGIPQATALNLEAGIPADAIRRRPDVMAAERRLKAATDTLGSAEAERYPTIYISGNIGLDSVHISDFFDWDSHFYNFGPGVTLPIFRGGQIEANIKIKTEQQKAQLAAYEHTVLSALGDIRTSLSGYVQEQERLRQLRLGVQAAQTAYEIALNTYNAGIGNFFDVLDAQRQLFALDEARVMSEGIIAQNQVNLYRSLCGGWYHYTPADRKALPLMEDPLLAPISEHDETLPEAPVEQPTEEAPAETPAPEAATPAQPEELLTPATPAAEDVPTSRHPTYRFL